MSNWNGVKILLFLILTASNPTYARIHNFETTHLKSQAGTGVAAVLLEESAFLNPASSSFYTNSSVYAQKDTSEESDSQNTSYPKRKSLGFVLAQGDQSLSGTLSYINQEDDIYKRKQWGMTFAAPLSTISSFGYSIRKINDLNTSTNLSKDYYKSVFGVSHVLSESTSLGIVVDDPFKSYAHDTRVYIGAQQNLLSYISGNIDIGANYTADDMAKNLLIRGSVQIRILDDFYLRAGGFNDKEYKEKGDGYGLSWIQPRLALEFAIKNTTSTISSKEVKNKETSFSLSYRGI
jgi:hypothetical protein